MAKKNIFGFLALTATAGLSLALATAGCGTHNGSTTTAEKLGGNNSVTFYYSVANHSTGRTTIDPDIVKVRYSFTKKDQDQIVKETDSYDLKPEVVVPEVPTEAEKVTAAYYDSTGSIVAVGINSIPWNYDEEKAEVENPRVDKFEMPENGEVDLQATRYVLSPEGTTTTTLIFPVEAKRTEKPKESYKVNLISFAQEVTGIDNYKDVLSKSDRGQTYTGVGFEGPNEGKIPAQAIKALILVPGGNIKASLKQPIYVTNQKPTSITIAPSPIDGKDVTVYNGEDSAEPYSKVLMSRVLTEKGGKANINLGQEVVTLHGSTEGGELIPTIDEEIAAVGAQSFTATASYSATSGQGPTPEAIDVTKATKFALEPSGAIVSIKDNKVTVESAPAKVYEAKVTASYNDYGKLDEKLIAIHTLRIYPAKSYVFFSETKEPSYSILDTYKGSEINKDKGLELYVMGLIAYEPDDISGVVKMRTCNFVLPESIVSTYPEAKCSSKNQKQGGSVISVSHFEGNEYKLTISPTVKLADDWVVTLDPQAYDKLGLPKFRELTIENK